MSNDPTAATATPAPPAGAALPEYGVVQRADGVYLDATLARPALAAAVDNIFGANNYFAGLDYPLLQRALYGDGTPQPAQAGGWLRFASGIVPFEPARRALYRALKIEQGQAEYVFEPVYLPDPGDPDGPGQPALLDPDEFVADLWSKGIRFGVDLDTVRAAIGASQTARLVVARRRAPQPGQDARVIEVSDDLHRSDAPRQLANGKLDLNSFQNRFPQIRERVRLLQKLPRTPGATGFELSGAAIEPPVPADVDLQVYCGPGTAIERTAEGEYLVSLQAGFLSVDSRSSQVSVGDKVVSHDGVSVKTTGNLQLTGDYEEFGEVQEKRVIEGEGITVHADVFGTVISRGGAIVLNRNLVGGSAINKLGDIVVRGVASRATIQASHGEVVLQRAENCIVSGTRVRIEQAVNCEILGEDVVLVQAEGCAVGGRRIVIENAAPRRQSEMLVYVQVPDNARLDSVLAATRLRIGQLGELAARHKADVERLTAQPDVRKYLRLAAGVRKNEITLTPEQVPAFQRMAQAVGPLLKEIGKVSEAMKAAEADREQGLVLAERLERQRHDAGTSTVALHKVEGDTQVRVIKIEPGAPSTYDLPAREIKARLRGTPETAVLFAASAGAFDWNSEQPGA